MQEFDGEEELELDSECTECIFVCMGVTLKDLNLLIDSRDRSVG